MLVEAYEHLLQGERLGKLTSFLSTNSEANLPTWASTLLLGAGATLAWLIEAAERDGRARWYGLAAIFLYLSLDEAGRLHERFIDPLRELLGAGGALQYTWIVVAIPVVVAVAVIYAPFMRGLQAPARRRILLGCALYVGGAAGMEAAGANREARGVGLGLGLLTAVEEAMEMAGALLALLGLAAYLRIGLGGTRLRLRDGVLEREAAAGDRVGGGADR